MLFSSFICAQVFWWKKNHSFPLISNYSFMFFFFLFSFFSKNQLVSCLFVHQTSRAPRGFFSWSVFQDRPQHYRFWPSSSFYYNSILKCQLSIKRSHRIITRKSFSILHSLTPLAPKEKKRALLRKPKSQI